MDNRAYYKYIFVVLLYRNMTDIHDLLKSIENKMNSYHVVLVNSFYDDRTNKEAEKIAKSFESCSFLSVENHGYGAGNNAGIEYARKHFNYDYIIISNPDIIIEQFDDSILQLPEIPTIHAPKIISRDYKRQNPNWAIHSNLLEYMQYLACKYDNTVLDYFVIAILKCLRILYGVIADIFHIKQIKIGNAHGSFLILSKSAINILYPLYDENMFLFYEEVYLGNRSYCRKVPTYYISNIIVNHKEDGSMRIANVNTRKEAHKSVVYYYEHKER